MSHVSRRTGLRIIKLVHTAVWAVLASTILALPVMASPGGALLLRRC